MSRVTFPKVPPGQDITAARAREAALLVREWYETCGESIDTETIVTVIRWVIHQTAPKSQQEKT